MDATGPMQTRSEAKDSQSKKLSKSASAEVSDYDLIMYLIMCVCV